MKANQLTELANLVSLELILKMMHNSSGIMQDEDYKDRLDMQKSSKHMLLAASMLLTEKLLDDGEDEEMQEGISKALSFLEHVAKNGDIMDSDPINKLKGLLAMLSTLRSSNDSIDSEHVHDCDTCNMKGCCEIEEEMRAEKAKQN